MMVSIRPDWQQRLAEWYSDDAVLARAEARAVLKLDAVLLMEGDHQ